MQDPMKTPGAMEPHETCSNYCQSTHPEREACPSWRPEGTVRG